MSFLERFVDVTNGRPNVRWTLVASTVVGSLALGWVDGVVGTILGVGLAITDAIKSGFAPWLAAVVATPLAGLRSAVASMWATNREVLVDGLGGLAWLGAIVEVMVLVWLLVIGTQLFFSRVGGG